MVSARREHEPDGADPVSGGEVVSEGKLGDITTMLDALAAGAARRHFNPHFADLRHQLGLALQLAGVVLFGRLKRHGEWRFTKAHIEVVRDDAGLCGFALLCEAPTECGQMDLEVCLLCVVDAAQRRGIGERLVRSAIARLIHGQALRLVTMAQNLPMNRLMKKLKARQISRSRTHQAERLATVTYAISAGDAESQWGRAVRWRQNSA